MSWRVPGAVLVVMVMALLGPLTACSSSGDDDRPSDEAVWGLAGLDSVSSHSRGFDVMVLRVGCSSGRQGTPEKPVVDVGESSIVVTFRLAPHVSGAQSCQGTPGVPYHVRLPEPIGQRTLVDGECHRGSEASATGLCQPDGVRLFWRNGEPRLGGAGG